jgi:protease PrsW
VVGTIVAATLEFDVLRALGGLPMLGVGLIEETSKLLVPLALLIPLRRYRTPADGVTVDILLLRGFLSPAGHMAWTGIAAAALYAAAATRGRREILRFVGAFVVAVVLHTLWDSQSSLIGTAVVAVASLGMLAWTAHRAARATVQADPSRMTRLSGPSRGR